MSQIKDLVGQEKTVPDNTDLIAIQQADGVTRRITRANFLSGSSSGSGNSDPTLNTIIYRDSNWNLATRVNQYVSRETLLWTSFGIDGSGSDSQTGILKIGYLKLKNKLYICVAGGGATSPTLKTIKLIKKSDDSILFSQHLGQILGVNSNILIPVIIDTSLIANNEVYLQFTDNATDGYGWLAFATTIFVE